MGRAGQTEVQAERQPGRARAHEWRTRPGDTGPCGLRPWEPGQQPGRQEAAPGKREERCPGRGGAGTGWQALPEQETEEEEEEDGPRPAAGGWARGRAPCPAHMAPWARPRTQPDRPARGFLFPHAPRGNILGR